MAEGRYILQAEGEAVYSEGSFLFVHPRIEPLASKAALHILQNALGSGRGQPTKALHIPAPKLIDPKFRYLLDLAPETWAPEEDWTRRGGKAGPCGKCKKVMPRDELLAVNPRWWNSANVQTRVRIRLYKPCFDEVTKYLLGMEWEPASQVSLQELA